jgi:hypothetical protein
MFLVLFKILIITITVLIVIVIILYLLSIILPPRIKNINQPESNRISVGNDAFSCGKGWIRRNRNNLMEMYVEGDAYERGLTIGKLTKELFNYQEDIFVADLNKKVPSKFKQFLLKLAIGVFNRKISKHIGIEYSEEIYGVSKSATSKYNYIAPPFVRIMNYHAAHDIGHTLQDMKYVGCTAFSVKGNLTVNNNILIGRNFDFHINDEFSRDKIVAFYNPAKGHKFAMITWPGMIGVTSGMNIKGITITINGAKSGIPKKTATPVSIIAREILQYAENLNEAEEIARKRSMFVSELLMVSSAKENKSIIIEKTPIAIDIYTNNSDLVICTNHFQGEILKNDPLNIAFIEDSSTMYRYNRVKELVKKEGLFNSDKIAKLLRERKGINDTEVGLGNEKAINQLIAHHSVIFDPANNIMYVSTPPYNIGEYLAYNLNDVFKVASKGCPANEIDDKNLTISKDEILFTGEYQKYEDFKLMLIKLKEKGIGKNEENEFFNTLQELNPEYYLSYSSIGDYLKSKKRFKEASDWYVKALQKEFHHKAEFKMIEKLYRECIQKH